MVPALDLKANEKDLSKSDVGPSKSFVKANEPRLATIDLLVYFHKLLNIIEVFIAF